jgi:hypothetical protein
MYTIKTTTAMIGLMGVVLLGAAILSAPLQVFAQGAGGSAQGSAQIAYKTAGKIK